MDSQVEQLVRARVGDPILAEGWFHVVADVGPSGSAWMDLVRIPIEWLIRRRSWRMPSHSYWVVTATDLHVFEFRFGSETRLRRTVGTWKLALLRAVPGQQPNSVAIHLPPDQHSWEMQGDRFTEGESGVIRLLTST